LSGIVSAAGRLGRGEWLLLSACDIVILDGRLLQRLARMREEGKAAVFSLNGRPQPFPGFYPAELLAGFAEALEQGLMKLTPIVRAMPRRELPLDGEDAPNGTGLVNVNRPEDLHLLEQLVSTGREAAAAEE
jgi:molybdopterin-guanine dinucleotide biosynthesis protein A